MDGLVFVDMYVLAEMMGSMGLSMSQTRGAGSDVEESEAKKYK